VTRAPVCAATVCVLTAHHVQVISTESIKIWTPATLDGIRLLLGSVSKDVVDDIKDQLCAVVEAPDDDFEDVWEDFLVDDVLELPPDAGSHVLELPPDAGSHVLQPNAGSRVPA
jgi:hypothetical protein